MNRFSDKQTAGLIRFCYLFPLLTGVLLLILALVPHLFFVSDGTLYPDVSLFGLLKNTRNTCIGYLTGDATNTAVPLRYFSYFMMTFWGLSVIAIVGYGLFALATAIVSTVVLSLPCRDRRTNRIKKYYRLFIPGRISYTVWNLLPILPSFFPLLLQHFSRSRLGQDITLHYTGIPGTVFAILFPILSCTLFFLLFKEQKRLKLDLFRLYKSENDR